MLSHILAILFPLFAIVAAGFVTGRRIRPDLSVANRLNVDVFVPALVFSAMADGSFHPLGYVRLALAVLLLIAGCGLAGWAVARVLGIQPKTLLPPLMFNNCGNLGLPVAFLAFGAPGLAAALVAFLVTNLFQFSFGIWLLDREAGLSGVWRSPVMIATMAGLAVSLGGLHLWPPLLLAAKMLGQIAIPLMLFALGARMAQARIRAVEIGLLGAILRPVLGMALAWATGGGCWGCPPGSKPCCWSTVPCRRR